MALVGINTAIEAMKQKFTEKFASWGAMVFTIHYKDYQFFGNNNQVTKEKKGAKKDKISNNKIPITKDQAELFKQNYHCQSILLQNSNIVSLGSSKTNPTVQVTGGDEDYAELNGYTLDAGRSLNLTWTILVKMFAS